MTGPVVHRVNIYYVALSRKCLLTLDLVECPHFKVQEAKNQRREGEVQGHRAGQRRGLAEKRQKQSSPASKFLMSVLAVCVFQGSSTFHVSCLVA